MSGRSLVISVIVVVLLSSVFGAGAFAARETGTLVAREGAWEDVDLNADQGLIQLRAYERNRDCGLDCVPDCDQDCVPDCVPDCDQDCVPDPDGSAYGNNGGGNGGAK